MTSRSTLKSLSSIVTEKCIKRKMPFETRGKLSRLQDILLESCARNLQEIFVEVDYSDNMTLKKDVKLERDIFERILAKGREIYLVMPPECVYCLLRFRDELNWQYIDLCQHSSSRLHLYKEELEDISTSKTSVKMLTCYSKYLVSDDDLEYISSFSSNLEHLEMGSLGLSSLKTESFVPGLRKDVYCKLQRKIKMPKLKHLVLGHLYIHQLVAIDHTSFFGTLRVLELYHYRSDSNKCLNSTILVEILRNCKNLVTLRFKNVHFGNKTEAIFETIGSLKNLRTLEMQYVTGEFDIWRIISNLPKLENLEVSFSNFFCSSVNFGELRLKYLGAISVDDENILRIPTEFLLRNANLINFDGLLCCFERESLITRPRIYDFFTAIQSADFLEHIIRLDRVENALLKIISMSFQLGSIVRITTRSSFGRHLSQDFWAKLITHYVSLKMYLEKYTLVGLDFMRGIY